MKTSQVKAPRPNPVALLAAGYEETFKQVTGSLDRLSADERAAVLGGNAREFYRLP